jgi:hypothetical protein
VLDAPRERAHNEILNVGAPGANFQVREIARIVGDVFPGCDVTVGATGADNRSYRVSFDKIHATLPDFRTSWDPRRGAEQLLAVFEEVELTDDDFRSRRFTRLKQIEHLLATGAIDNSFFWTAMPSW